MAKLHAKATKITILYFIQHCSDDSLVIRVMRDYHVDQSLEITDVQAFLYQLYGSNDIGDWIISNYKASVNENQTAMINGHKVVMFLNSENWLGEQPIVITIQP